MKRLTSLSIVLTVFLALVLLAGCSPSSSSRDGLVVGQSFRLKSGETLNQDITVAGGSAVLEEGSTLNGNIAVMGGSLSINGVVNGDISAMGGVVTLGSKAIIHGDVATVGANLSRASGSLNDGEITGEAGDINIPDIVTPAVDAGRWVANFFWRIFQAFAVAALAVLVSLFAQRPMERAGDTLSSQPILAGGLGLLTLIVLPVLFAVLAITIVLAPVSLLGLLGLGIALVFGWLVAGAVVGERIGRMLNQSWSAPLCAGIGTLALALVTALLSGIVCIGWILPFLISVVGLGSVILTRFGTQTYPPPVQAAPAPIEVIDVETPHSDHGLE